MGAAPTRMMIRHGTHATLTMYRSRVCMVNPVRITMISLACLLLLLVLPLSGTCMDTNGRYVAYGYGADACGTFLEARRTNTDTNYISWVTGYLTAVDTTYPITYGILGSSDIERAMVWLENYCAQNSLRPFAIAVYTLVDELYPKRIMQQPR